MLLNNYDFTCSSSEGEAVDDDEEEEGQTTSKKEKKKPLKAFEAAKEEMRKDKESEYLVRICIICPLVFPRLTVVTW